MSNINPVLSVITVVYNNVQGIERTMLSVLNQTYPNIEYIIIDGKSDDGTVEVIEKYRDRLAQFVSQKDKGIYYAMSKGLTLMTGDYVLFMNSGDEIYAPDTVARIFATAHWADIYYGETEMVNANGESLGRRRHKAPEKFSWRSFKNGMTVSHQAIYIKYGLIGPFDKQFKLSADVDWIIRAAKKAYKIVNTHMYVAKYEVGGISKKKHIRSLFERFLIMCRYYGVIPTLLRHLVMPFKLIGYYAVNRRTND